ncbi:MAG: TSUP family transporter [Lachnospirales bacterium]
MELSIWTFIIVCPMVFLASFVDAVAGGGGLISLPAYLLAGVPPKLAIGTNKLSSATGTVFSTARYCKNGCFDLKLALPSIVVALIGSYIGAKIVLVTSDEILKYVLIIVLPVTAFFVLKKKNFDQVKNKPKRKTQFIIAVLASFIIGMYDGFYGPGTGTFLILIYTGLVKLDLLTASGNTKLVNLSSNVAALVTFIFSGNIVYALGFAASVFSIAGHYLGAGMVMKSGTKIVKPIIILVILLLLIKICLGI